jgi:hypothetical protein
VESLGPGGKCAEALDPPLEPPRPWSRKRYRSAQQFATLLLIFLTLDASTNNFRTNKLPSGQKKAAPEGAAS